MQNHNQLKSHQEKSREWTYEDLITTVLKSNEEIIYWLQNKHLLASSKDCSKCSSQCRLVKRKGTLYWRCPRKGCQAVISVRDKSFFATSRLSLQTIVKLMQAMTSAAHEVNITEGVAIDWYNFFRDVCGQYFLDNPIVIGGPGKVVEIDESKFGKRKYHRGRSVDGHWVFGGIERGSRHAFMMVVPDRSKNTLMPIITQYIRPGTTIISDEWRAYNDIGISGYTHQTVNHSVNFVNPSSGAHTNGVEGYWSCTKRMMGKQGVMSTSNDLFPTYLLEFLWRRRFGDRDLFEALLEHIAEQYQL